MSCRLNNTQSALLVCPKPRREPHIDLQHSISRIRRQTERDGWEKKWHDGHEQANRKEGMRQTLNIHQLVYCGSRGPAAPIHLRSPHSGVFREGQNLENRLHTRHFVTRHPSPASPTPRSRTQLGHGRSQKYIRWGGAASAACFHTAFVLHLRRICCPFGRVQKTGTRWHLAGFCVFFLKLGASFWIIATLRNQRLDRLPLDFNPEKVLPKCWDPWPSSATN